MRISFARAVDIGDASNVVIAGHALKSRVLIRLPEHVSEFIRGLFPAFKIFKLLSLQSTVTIPEHELRSSFSR